MFNASQLLESLMAAGQDLVKPGKNLADDKLNLPTDETERSAMMNGMGKGALATSPSAPHSPQALVNLNEAESHNRSVKILQAIIAAAKADGHIDDKERATL